uniref:Uncharacterized protein n=1 Tax=Knipowitschia caucasica TaxID=637954 RepID=A0AAV2JPE4_KNICA
MTLPLHRLYQPAEANIATAYTTHQYRTDPQDHLEQTFAFTQKKLGDSAEGRKAYYDPKASHNELQVGDQKNYLMKPAPAIPQEMPDDDSQEPLMLPAVKSDAPAIPEERLLHSQLKFMWRKNSSETYVSQVLSQVKGYSFLIHHSDLLTLKPHNWLDGEVSY